MIDTRNKPLMLLVGLNILALVAIFWLVGVLLSRDDPATTIHKVEQATVPPVPVVTTLVELAPVIAEPAAAAAGDPPPVTSAQDAAAADIAPRDPAPVNGDTEAETPASAAYRPPAIVETVSNIDVYYDGSIIRMEESDNHGRRHTMISTSLKDIDRIAPQDAAYLTALRDLKAGRRSHVSMTQVTRERADEIITDEVVDDTQLSTTAGIDHFNKVDVSAPTNAPAAVKIRQNLAERIAALVSEPEKATGENADYAKASLADYIETLDVASNERANEMRTIRVERGDSLWLIAQRAYGSGFSYPRIFDANPHIRNPHMIREGDILRVPL